MMPGCAGASLRTVTRMIWSGCCALPPNSSVAATAVIRMGFIVTLTRPPPPSCRKEMFRS